MSGGGGGGGLGGELTEGEAGGGLLWAGVQIGLSHIPRAELPEIMVSS